MTDLATLTVAEADCLAMCEQSIERGLKTFVEVGTSLATIRDNRLYRAEFATFEDYCVERWGISRPRAYELMTAAEVVSAMADTELPAPENERQARELARVPEPERAEVWRETVERTEGKPTAAAIRDTYERTQSPATSPEPGPAGVDVAGPGHDHLSAGEKADARPGAEQKPNRRPLPDAFRDAAYDLLKVAERIERLAADDRFPRNAEQVGRTCRADLLRAGDLLATVVDRIPNPTEESTE